MVGCPACSHFLVSADFSAIPSDLSSLICTQPSWVVFLTCSFDRWPILKSRISQALECLGGCSKWVYVDKLQQSGNDPKPCPLGVSLIRFTSFNLSHSLRVKGTSGLQAQSPTWLVQKPLPLTNFSYCPFVDGFCGKSSLRSYKVRRLFLILNLSNGFWETQKRLSS